MKRRTTMKRAQAAALGQSFGAGGGSPSPYQQQQQHPHSHAGTPQPPAANLAPPRAGPEMKRFTLSDTPASYTPPPPQHSQSLPPESGPHNSIRPQQPSSRPAPVQVKPPAQKGPETFEAMGIQTTTMKKVRLASRWTMRCNERLFSNRLSFFAGRLHHLLDDVPPRKTHQKITDQDRTHSLVVILLLIRTRMHFLFGRKDFCSEGVVQPPRKSLSSFFLSLY